MKLSRSDIITLVERVINNEPCLREWDELTSLKHKDPFTQIWGRKLSDVERSFGDKENGRMLDDRGVEKLREFVDELKRSSGSQGGK